MDAIMAVFKILLFSTSFVLVTCGNTAVEQCMAELGEIKHRLHKLESASQLSRPLLPRQVVPVSKVAFYTQLSRDVSSIGDHQIIVFDTVTTNIGMGYNAVNGTFTAPVSGIYVFFWLNTNKDHSYMNTELVQNTVVMGKSMSDAMDHGDYAAASNTAVLQLHKGDDVFVRSGTWHSAKLAGDFYTTFSGWLLYAD